MSSSSNSKSNVSLSDVSPESRTSNSATNSFVDTTNAMENLNLKIELNQNDVSQSMEAVKQLSTEVANLKIQSQNINSTPVASSPSLRPTPPAFYDGANDALDAFEYQCRAAFSFGPQYFANEVQKVMYAAQKLRGAAQQCS